MVIRILALVVLVGALGCRTTEPPAAVEEPSSSGEFGPEDGGLGDRDATANRWADIDLRSIYFDFDDSSLKSEARQGLRHNADVLLANPDLSVQIEGNCDERGSDEYNLALGMRRAEAAMRYLQDLGVDASRLDTLSYGEENPQVSGSGEAAWARNRRDDFQPR